MTSPDTTDRVAAVIDQLFGVPAAALTPQTELQDGLQLDSLSVIELQVALEDTFGVRLDEADADDVRTVADLARAVDAARARTDAAPTAGSTPDAGPPAEVAT